MLRFPAVWLRDNCPCTECLDPVSGQKLRDITELPDDVTVSAVSTAVTIIVVTFAPDRHRSSSFVPGWPRTPSTTTTPTGTTATGGPRMTRNCGCRPTWTGCPRPVGRATWASPRTGRAPWTRCSAGASCYSTTWPPNPGWCSRSRRASASCGDQLRPAVRRPGRAPAGQPGLHQPPDPAAHRHPSGIRCRPSSCCTACTRQTTGEKPAWSTGSRRPPSFAPRIARHLTFPPSFLQSLYASHPTAHPRAGSAGPSQPSAQPLRRPYREVVAFYTAYRRWPSCWPGPNAS